METYPAFHSQVTHHGAQVAPQRCPILRMSIHIITDILIYYYFLTYLLDSFFK